MSHRAEEVAANAKGSLKKGKATLEGFTGIFRKLAQEHADLCVQLSRLQNSDDPKLRAELFPRIRKELLSHEKGELTVLYPALREFPESVSIADVHDRQSTQLQTFLQTVTATGYADPAWESHFGTLVELVKRHVAHEESETFPLGERLLGDITDELQTEYENMKEAAMIGLG